MFACIPGIQILYFYICIVCLVQLKCKSTSNLFNFTLLHCLLLKEREWWDYIVVIDNLISTTYLGVWHLFLVFHNVILYGWYVRTDSPPGSSSCPVTNIFLPPPRLTLLTECGVIWRVMEHGTIMIYYTLGKNTQYFPNIFYLHCQPVSVCQCTISLLKYKGVKYLHVVGREGWWENFPINRSFTFL